MVKKTLQGTLKSIVKILARLLGPQRLKNYVLTDKELLALTFIKNGYLKDIGWWKAQKSNTPINNSDEPIPWITYSMIDFLENRIQSHFKVFEFGSGYSTIFFSNKVAKVVSVEHDENWYKTMSERQLPNCTLVPEKLSYEGDYCRTIGEFEDTYDIVMVDGRDRVNCLIQAASKSFDTTVIILDDSERKEYNTGIEHMLERNWKKLDFWGISPGLFYRKCTSVFYKRNNCLEI